MKITNDDNSTKTKTGATVKGTTVEYNGKTYVKIDGSELLTPVNATSATKTGDRVTVNIQDHTATITGNLTSPSASDSDVQAMGSQISEFEIVLADKVNVGELNAQTARIDNLYAENATITGRLTAGEAKIGDLEADNVTINETLTAHKASINNLEATKIDAEVVVATYATIKDLEVANADIYNLNANYATFKTTTTETLTAIDASITDLDVKKLNATEAEITYANIDFSNIDMAAIEEFFSKSGIIKDLIVDDQTITGELIGVTIKGDLIEGNTIVADKLVVKGEDGLYYKLNTDGVSTTGEQTDYNSLSGTVIQAKSITAEKIAVEDLVAFGATIGGFHITDDSIYSGVKTGPLNTTRGVYMDNDGQFSLGDANNFFRYFKDSNGDYKLELSASSLKFTTTGTTVLDELDGLRDELAIALYIDSSQGTMIDSSTSSTVLSVTVYRGSQRITDIKTLHSVIGETAYLEWSSKGVNDTSYVTIPSSDSRIGNDGFTLTLDQADVGAKTTYTCTLIGPDASTSGSSGSGSSGSGDSTLAQQAYDLAANNEVRITKAETSIQQNNESITLCATKEEVQHVESLAGTAHETAVSAESLIKQLSDNISMLVTDGNGSSLMSQTDDGWVFSTLDLQNAINSTSEGLNELVNEFESTSNTVKVLQQAVDDLGILSDYIIIGTYEDEPCIELGETDSDFKLRITNTKVVYTEGTSVLAYFTNQSMYIKNAVIEEELQQGGFVWKVRSNGNMGLVWKEVSS